MIASSAMRNPLVLVASPVALDDRAHTSAARPAQIARALAAQADVILAAPHPAVAGDVGVRLIGYESERSLHALVDNCDVAVLPVALFERFPTLVWAHSRLVVDLHDGLAPASPGRRVGDFFLCGSAADRETWLRVLFEHGRLSARDYRQRDRLLRFAAVVESPAGGQSAWAQATAPLRAYCASVRQETSTPWSTPRALTQAWRVFRRNGPGTFLRVALAHLKS